MSLMLYIMPLFSAYICFIVPAGAGFYWAISAIVMLLQSIFLNIKYNPKKMAEKIQAEMDADKEKSVSKELKHANALKSFRITKTTEKPTDMTARN